MTRRRFLLLTTFVAMSIWKSPLAIAAPVAVPLALQAELLVKVAVYDRNLRERAAGTVRVLVVVKRDDAASLAAAGNVEHRLDAVDVIGGMPHQHERVTFTNAKDLAARIRERRISCVYLMPGLSTDIDGIREALTGGDVLTVSAVPEDVARGVVLGFDQTSGKPKLLVNLTQAQKQYVNLTSDLLRIATVIR